MCSAVNIGSDSIKSEVEKKKRPIECVVGSVESTTEKKAKLASASSSIAAAVAVAGKQPFMSVQNDPKASEVFKSLFTSSARAKNQQKAHWVTFNPQYF